jgi:hypothetical protein
MKTYPPILSLFTSFVVPTARKNFIPFITLHIPLINDVKKKNHLI